MLRRLAFAALLLPTLASAEEPKKAEWKGTVGAGLIHLTGNSDTTTFTGSLVLSRETFGWILELKGAGAYGENRPAAGGDKETTAYKMGGLLRADRKFGETWAVFAIAGVEADHVASIEYRSAFELGAGATWLDEKRDGWQRLLLRTDLGMRYGYEARYQYYGATTGPLPGVELVAPRLGLAFRWGFSKDVFVTEEAEVLATVSGGERVLARSVTKLSSRLTDVLTFGVGYTVTHDTAPAPGKERTDTALTALLEVGI